MTYTLDNSNDDASPLTASQMMHGALTANASVASSSQMIDLDSGEAQLAEVDAPAPSRS